MTAKIQPNLGSPSDPLPSRSTKRLHSAVSAPQRSRPLNATKLVFLSFWSSTQQLQVSPILFHAEYIVCNFATPHQPVSDPIKEHLIGVVAEWLSRKTRNLVPSGAQVRILPTSFFVLLYLLGSVVGTLWWCLLRLVKICDSQVDDHAAYHNSIFSRPFFGRES